ncbi:unnamed protein product [Ceutorhynchus assimilis]|uniref:T-box domain-containing protein n=1 Tax=Ceutorhynchus assimilis TaxID=467358 RepID=A0A9N9QS11_9CUCU|nr:unnamed protein product [Ceutorhynchus assimilis]
MIITKSGRRMFPSLQVQLSELDPQEQYCVFMEMVPASRCRYKYSSAGGWAPAGSEEAQSPHRIYLHPESPAKGDYWMSQPISFGRVKLTNMPAPPAGQIVLSSMHKYQPRIIVVKTSDPRTIAWSPSTYAAFPETQFIAVTAYQNEKITQLKIDNNPFAKGFRHNGQAKCKRKRACEDKEDELISVDSFEENNNSISDSSIDSIESDEARSRSSSFGSPSSVKCAKIEDVTYDSFSQAPFPVTPQVYLPPVYPYYYPYYSGYYYPYVRSEEPLFYSPKFMEVKKPRKITDFSIRALIGC